MVVSNGYRCQQLERTTELQVSENRKHKIKYDMLKMTGLGFRACKTNKVIRYLFRVL